MQSNVFILLSSHQPCFVLILSLFYCHSAHLLADLYEYVTELMWLTVPSSSSQFASSNCRQVFMFHPDSNIQCDASVHCCTLILEVTLHLFSYHSNYPSVQPGSQFSTSRTLTTVPWTLNFLISLATVVTESIKLGGGLEACTWTILGNCIFLSDNWFLFFLLSVFSLMHTVMPNSTMSTLLNLNILNSCL